MPVYGGLFGRNPFGPLHEHALKVQDCLDPLMAVVAAFCEGDRVRTIRHCRKIYELEGQADYIKNELRRQLTHSMFSRVERSDILMLISAQDDVSDGCEAAAMLLEVRPTVLAPSLSEPLAHLAKQVGRVVSLLPDIILLLREYPKPGSVAEQVLEQATRVHDAGFKAAGFVRDFVKRLFAVESDLDPVSVLLLMRLAETLGDVAGSAENASDCAARIASGA